MSSLHRSVLIVGIVSFLTDVSSEMIYPLLPVFLAVTLGATAFQLGLIEGVAESTASILKMVSGVLTDRSGRRKPFLVFGYGLAGAVRPLIGLAGSWPVVLGLRFLDRVGKGLRTSPRDALIADVTAESTRGAAYGFHRAMDHAGAVIGPLVASALLLIPGTGLREVFLYAGIPAALALLVLHFGLSETRAKKLVPVAHAPGVDFSGLKRLGSPYRTLLAANLVFALGNSTDAFLIARLTSAGVQPAELALLWSALHVVKSGSTWIGGRLSDRIGPKASTLAGWGVFGICYFCLGWLESRAALTGVFLAYGLFFGLTEPAERAWISRLAPAGLRGNAFGWFHMVSGLSALPASLMFGWIWTAYGPKAAFSFGAILSFVAALILLRVPGFKRPI